MVAGHKILPIQSTIWMFYGNPHLVIIYNSEGGEGNKQAIELCLFLLPTELWSSRELVPPQFKVSDVVVQLSC